jgi:hypothetical protein
MSVLETIEEAQKELASGHNKQAARLLTDAAFQTRDPNVEATIRDVALEGRSSAGWLGKGRWDEIIRITEARATTEEQEPVNGKGARHDG